jgi:DNA-nicking Smr family endonuclease
MYNQKHIMEKYCKKCQTSKSIAEFSKNQSQCKDCKNKHYTQNKNKWEDYALKNKEKIQEANIKWNSLNKEHIFSYNSLYNKENKVKKNKGWKEWYNNNPTYHKDRYANDLNFRIRQILRARINQALRGNMKEKSSLDLLGCTIEEYKKYLSKQFDKNMNWENYGTYWEIDHIKPCDSFDLSNVEEQKKCFIFTNTQPMDIISNRIKSNKYEK